MRRLKTEDLGGLPIALDDLRWIEEGVKDALKGIVNYADPTEILIISGCEYSPDRIDDLGEIVMTEGYILFDGEIFKVPATTQSLTGGNTLFYWDLKTTYDVAGNVVFENSSINDIYEIREFEIKQASSLPAGKIQVESEKHIFDSYRLELTKRAKINNAMASFSSGIGTSLTNPISYTENLDGMILLYGEILDIGGLGDVNMGNITTALIPSSPKMFKVDILDSSSPNRVIGYGMMEIKTNGQVWLYPTPYSSPASSDKVLVNTFFPLNY
jgi:hypothetical protein